MVAELTLTRNPVCKTHYRVRVYREGKRKALRRKAGTCFKLGAIVLISVLATVTVLTYNSYRSFAQQIDQQIAGGYLRSHAGLYAAPREIEKGARLSKAQLATSLQRAGYARDKASNIWSGSFLMSESSIRILPRQGTETHE
jgi:endonuclease III